MGSTIGNVFSSGLAVAMSPLATVAVISIIGTARGRVNAGAFAAGWVMVSSLVIGASIALGALLRPLEGGEPATWTYWVQLGLAATMLSMVIVRWIAALGRDADDPRWMRILTELTPGRSMTLAAQVAASPKNFVMTIGAAAAVLTSTERASAMSAGAVVFVLIGSAGVTVPLVLHAVDSPRTRRILVGGKAYLVEHHSAIVTTVLLLIAAEHAGDAMSGVLS